jgi:DNA-directed RNA polymerase subunit F
MRKEILDFIDFAREETDRYEINFELRDVKYFRLVDEGYAKCHGYFDEDGMALKCATNMHHSKWVPILIHEYSHFEQWVEQCPAWTDSICKEDETGNDFYLWVMGKKEIPYKIAKKIVSKTRDMELDCERRAHKNIKKFNLPLDREAYAQQANAYIHFYNWTLERRTWYKVKKCPYHMREITKLMPKTLRGNYDKTPQGLMDLFDKYCL